MFPVVDFQDLKVADSPAFGLISPSLQFGALTNPFRLAVDVIVRSKAYDVFGRRYSFFLVFTSQKQK